MGLCLLCKFTIINKKGDKIHILSSTPLNCTAFPNLSIAKINTLFSFVGVHLKSEFVDAILRVFNHGSIRESNGIQFNIPDESGPPPAVES